MKYIFTLLTLLCLTLSSQQSIELCDEYVTRKYFLKEDIEVNNWNIEPYVPFEIINGVLHVHYNQVGTYQITAVYGNDLCFNDAIYMVNIEDCPITTFWIPNSFSIDGLNPEFKPKGLNIKDYKMEIFNRWGELIFTTIDIDKGWDGYINGTPCQIDVYQCKIIYKDIKNKWNEYNGRITIKQ